MFASLSLKFEHVYVCYRMLKVQTMMAFQRWMPWCPLWVITMMLCTANHHRYRFVSIQYGNFIYVHLKTKRHCFNTYFSDMASWV